MPLLWALRDVLDLTGTKYGCGAGFMRRLHRSPRWRSGPKLYTTITETAGRKATTEGLSPDRSHPVQVAWIIAAAALLKAAPPTLT